MPPLSPEEAAALHTCFVKDTAANIVEVSAACQSEGIAVYTPAGTEALFDKLLPPEFRLLVQRGEDFGDRLFHAAVDLFAIGYGAVCLIGSDSPTLPAAVLSRAVASLARPGKRVVLGPAEDGGYYLIGLTAPDRRLFTDIAWSTDQVLAQTIACAKRLRLGVDLLPRWYDVDDAESLRALHRELSSGQAPPVAGYEAPHTRQYLFQLMALREDGLTLRQPVGSRRAR